jgi:hypothetical protein
MMNTTTSASEAKIQALFANSTPAVDITEALAHEAFKNKGRKVWSQLQFNLFDMNLRMMRDGYGLGSARFEKEMNARNTIERVEQQYLLQEKVPADIKDAGEFMVWLKQRIYGHRVNYNPLFELFDADDLSAEEVRFFLANYRVNMQRFHLHVAAYSLIVPFEMREELYHNLYDEFGQGDFTKAHPNLFEPLMDYFGGAREDDINAETCNLLNTKINLCWFADSLHYGLGGMGGLELSIPMQQRRVLAHLRRRGLSEKLVEFFVVHCELDEEHGEGWFAAGMPHMNTHEDFQKVFSGAMRMLDARAVVYDGIHSAILKARNPQWIETHQKYTAK